MTAWGTKLRPLLKGQCHLLSVTMKKIQNTGGGAGGPGSPATPQAKMFLPGQSPPVFWCRKPLLGEVHKL